MEELTLSCRIDQADTINFDIAQNNRLAITLVSDGVESYVYLSKRQAQQLKEFLKQI